MISLEQYKKVLDSGLLLDHYYTLCNLRDGRDMPKSRRIDGFINLLNKKGYIEDGALTEKAFEVIDLHPTLIVQKEEVETPRFDFGGWVLRLHKKCQDRLTELTGKPQVVSKFKGEKKGWPFLPNIGDFTERLFTTIQKYKLKDMDAIDKAILNHIDTCNQGNNWFPLMKYYINKKGEGSQMVTDIESGIETVASGKSTQKFL
jgi:hypothetical protein